MRYCSCPETALPIAVLSAFVLTVTATGGEVINVAPLANVMASARMDGAHDATQINDEDPHTYWSAWPYTMKGEQDLVTLEVTLPVTAVVHRIEVDAGYVSPEVRLSIHSEGRWQEHGARFDRPTSGPRLVFALPVALDGLRFEYPRIKAEQSGVVVRELRIMGELPPSISMVDALADDQTPDMDWQPVTGTVQRGRCGGGQNQCFEAELATAQPVQRIEMQWRAADYARRTILELVCEDGRRLFVVRQRFSTSFTFKQPYQVKRVRIHCTEIGSNVEISDLRLLGRGIPPVPPTDSKVNLWAETPLVKVRRDATGSAHASSACGDTLRIELARNEYEGGQIIVRNAGAQALRDLSVTVEALKQADGAALPADSIVVQPVGWVNHDYADVLLPTGPFSVASGEIRPVWVTVHAGLNTSPGIYRGKARCRLAGKPIAELPVEITVWNFALPALTHFNTHYFSIWGTDRWLRSALADSQQRERLLESVANQFIRHRVSPGTCFILEDYEKQMAEEPWVEYLSAFDRWTGKLIDGGLSFIGVLDGPRHGLQGGPATEKDYWQAIEAHLRERGWLDRFSVRVGDEPPPGNQKVAERAKQFINWAPSLRRQCAFSSFGSHGTPGWAGLINEWGICPRVYGDDRLEDVVSFCQERVQAGDGVSWYVHHALSIEAPPYFPRMYLWYMWKHRIPGALLYGVSEWAHRDVDRWEDEFVIHGSGFRTWGVLLWPAEGALLDSVRWEAIRDGIEDYEMHLLLAKAIQQAARINADDPGIADARRVLDETDPLFVTFDAHESDRAVGYQIRDSHSPGPILCTHAIPADLIQARRRIADAIRALHEIKPAGAS